VVSNTIPGTRIPMKGNTAKGKSAHAKVSNDICAVIVTYHPEYDLLSKVIGSLLTQVDHICVVDNSDDSGVKIWFDSEKIKGAHLISMGENRGVAGAHNQGLRWAKKIGAQFLLLVDQDSIPKPDMVSVLHSSFEQLLKCGKKVSAVGPRYHHDGSGGTSNFIRFGLIKFKQVRCDLNKTGQVMPVDFLISSGSLISCDVLETVGEMEEGLFIDHVDTEWYLRAKSKGYQAYGVCDAVMDHRLGEGLYRIWLGRWRYLPRHSPLRHYYIVRNSLLLYRRRYSPIKWIINDIVRLGVIILFYSAVQPPRWERIKMLSLGIMHGLQGRTGPLDGVTHVTGTSSQGKSV